MNERIMQLIAYLGIKTAEFERLCNLSNGAVSKMGENTRRSTLDKISKKYPSVNISWLLTGEGSMLTDESSNNVSTTSQTLPLISIDAVAGFPTTDNEGITLGQCEQYSVPEFIAKGAQFLIRVSGSSMYPSYNNGDILACRKIDDVTFFQWGKVYVLDTNQGALVKRLFQDKDANDSITCHSDNTEHYPDFTLPKNEIRSLSIVIGVIRIE